MLDTLCTTAGNMSMLFEVSKMHVWGVNTIPITPATHNLPAEVQTRLATTPTRLHNFYPKGLLPHNIGSNEGLAKVIRIQMQDMGLEPPGAPPTKYSAMLSDINIFDRVIKVTQAYNMRLPSDAHDLDDVRQEWWRNRTAKVSQLQPRVLALLQTGNQDDLEGVREYDMGTIVASYVSWLEVQRDQPVAPGGCHAYGVHGAGISALQDRA